MSLKYIFAGVLLSASFVQAQQPAAYSREDPAGDLNTAIETDSGFDFRKVTIERKGSSKLEIGFEMEGVIPKNPKKETAILLFMDLDNDPATGPRYGEMAPDLNLVIFKTPRAMQWEAKVDKVSTVSANENFAIQKLDLRGKTATVVISSPWFKQFGDFTYFAEVVQEGQHSIDRLPDGDLFPKTTFDTAAPAK